jgi:aminomethyltransferase
LFDIGHMGRLRVEGPDALASLELVTTNQVAKLSDSQIQYSLVVNEAGGVLDDILVYHLPAGLFPKGGFGLVCNAANRAKVLDHFRRHAEGFDAKLKDRTVETAMIAVQGPQALETVQRVFEAPQPLAAVNYYHLTGVSSPALKVDGWASRTGYTGEDGFELVVDRGAAVAVWQALLEAGRDLGIRPCGLGARDTLRFEAAMPLYGHELTEAVNPYAAGLGWAVKLDKGDFVGREALQNFKVHPGRARIGLALDGKRIARQGCPVQRDGARVGTVTSGTFSPTLGRSLAMALVDPTAASQGLYLEVEIRGRDEPARVVPLPFYRRVGAG